MAESALEKINGYYERNFEQVFARLQSGGCERSENYRLLGWESRAAQYKRFSVLAENVELEGAALLDVGCGLGDLYHFLTQGLRLPLDYTGTDISAKMVEMARAQAAEIALPEGVDARAAFLQTDVFANSSAENALLGKTFDVVYASGIFNLDLGNNLDFLRLAFARFSQMCAKCFACSLLSESSGDKEATYFYYNERMLREALAPVLAANPGSSFTLKSGYLENDMTLIWRR